MRVARVSLTQKARRRREAIAFARKLAHDVALEAAIVPLEPARNECALEIISR